MQAVPPHIKDDELRLLLQGQLHGGPVSRSGQPIQQPSCHQAPPPQIEAYSRYLPAEKAVSSCQLQATLLFAMQQ
jgi:hypothetical protein